MSCLRSELSFSYKSSHHRIFLSNKRDVRCLAGYQLSSIFVRLWTEVHLWYRNKNRSQYRVMLIEQTLQSKPDDEGKTWRHLTRSDDQSHPRTRPSCRLCTAIPRMSGQHGVTGLPAQITNLTPGLVHLARFAEET